MGEHKVLLELTTSFLLFHTHKTTKRGKDLAERNKILMDFVHTMKVSDSRTGKYSRLGETVPIVLCQSDRSEANLSGMWTWLPTERPTAVKNPDDLRLVL